MSNELNLFGGKHTYFCKYCKGTNVIAEFSVYRKMNEAYSKPEFYELLHQDSFWCNDCEKETEVNMSDTKLSEKE
jgi:hypothetical protein